MESSSSGSSSKRARLPSNGVIQVPVCLVDGCTADLGKCRDYHRRHRVCEVHSKTARVFIRGQEKRFCQQCSRFHSLDEFDDGKRSCRKRLDGHNRRRRKPQPPTLSMNSARLFSDHQGTRYLQFGSSQMFPTAAETSAWSTKATKPENHDDFLFNNNTNNNSSSSSQSTLNFIASNISPNCKSGKQFPFLQTDSPPPGLEPKMFSHGAIPVIETDRALSLLSSPPQPEIGLTHMVHPHPHPPHPPARPSIQQNLSYNNGCFGRGSEPADGSVLSNGSSSFHSMFQIGADDGSSSSAGSGSHHHSALSFSWQ